MRVRLDCPGCLGTGREVAYATGAGGATSRRCGTCNGERTVPGITSLHVDEDEYTVVPCPDPSYGANNEPTQPQEQEPA